VLIRKRSPAECLRLATAALGVSFLVGCTRERPSSRRIDALIERYGGVQAFDSASWKSAQAAHGLAVQAAEFGADWEERIAGLVGRSRISRPELQRLVMVTSDSATLYRVLAQIKSMFDQTPFEACVLLADGTRDRALVWRAASRGGAVIRAPAPSASGATRRNWEGRVILVRHAVRRDDVGEIVSDLPCPTAAIDGFLSGDRGDDERHNAS
jgi:hypothetical protein